MCPWGAPSSISRNSPPLLAALLLNSRRRRRSLPFFSFRPFPSRFPSVLADSVLGESRLASSERSNIGPGRSPSSLSLSSSAPSRRPPILLTNARRYSLSLSLFLSLPSARLSSPLLSSLLFPPSHGTPPDFFFFVPPLFTRPFHRAPRPFQPFFPSLVLTRTYSPLSSFIGLRCLAMAIQR